MSTEMKPVAAETKSAPTSESRKAKARPPRSATKAEKLVCRYCGSDDLAVPLENPVRSDRTVGPC
jgi:hypothetical protein